MRLRICLFVTTILVLSSTALAQDEERGFQSLFNGKNLDGWVPVNTAPSTWKVNDGLLICSGKPIGELRTTRMYQNFVLEVEWRHMKQRGNAGIFVWADDITARGVPFHRSIEVQVLENAYGNTRSHTTHGDIFPIHGAIMKPVNGRGGSRAFPTEFRSKPSPEWNHYRIECRDGEISLAVNGKVVTRGKECRPRKGYICLESEGGVVHYRNMRIKALPDTPIAVKDVAIANRGYRSLYNGIDLTGWKPTGEGWKPQDWILSYTGRKRGSLTTSQSFADVGFLFDARLDKEGHVAVILKGTTIKIDRTNRGLSQFLTKGRGWNRFEGELRNNRLTLKLNGTTIMANQQTADSGPGPLRLQAQTPVSIANIYVRQLKKTK